MFRQVAEYSITTHQRVGKNSFKPALLAFLLALLLGAIRLRKSAHRRVPLSRHPPMWFPSCSPACARASGCSAQPRAGRRRRFQSFCACRHSVANAPLPGGVNTGGCVSLGAVLLSRGGGEESSPAPSERNAKHEHDRKPHLHRMPRNRSATHKSNRQADQVPGSTAGMENCFTAGMSHTRHHATVRNTGSGSRLLEIAYP